MMAMTPLGRVKLNPEKTQTVIAEFSIVPIGQVTTSLGPWVARALEGIRKVPGVKYQLTPMGTILEAGELESIFKAVEVAHESLVGMGAGRVLSTLRIDDRRDKPRSMADKVKSVKMHLPE